MLLAPVALVAALSLSSALTAAGRVIRVPLVAARARDTPCHVDADFLTTHLAGLAVKYRTAFAAYESNTGSPHPLEESESVSVLSSGAPTRRLRDTDAPRARHTKRDDIPLSVANFGVWMGSISVGTPPQNFTVDFDTGSSDLILPDQACDSSCDGHARYDPSASSTSVDLGRTFSKVYRSADVNGTQYADNVYMGGYEAVNQTFGAATTYTSGLESPTFRPDGILGMGFPPISAFGTLPVFQTLISSGAVAQGVFGLALSSESGKSELTIGGTNTNMYQESTTEYVDVTVPAFWQVQFAGLARPGLNGAPEVTIVNKTSYAQAIVDSGTTLIVTSDTNAQAYYANVTGAKPSTTIGDGFWTVPCDIIDSIAPTLTFGSRSFAVSPSTFNLGPVSQGSTDCVAGIVGGGNAWWLIGDVFLQNVYTIFDVANSRIGFADLL